jgi:GH15 family glucan-1,4-alpha-glucosidase
VDNGRVAIAFDSNLNIRDLFYPRVGLENHVSGHELKTGLCADREFQWLDNSWKRETKYMPKTLVSRSMANHPGIGIQIETNDAVHNSFDVFLRKDSQ